MWHDWQASVISVPELNSLSSTANLLWSLVDQCLMPFVAWSAIFVPGAFSVSSADGPERNRAKARQIAMVRKKMFLNARYFKSNSPCRFPDAFYKILHPAMVYLFINVLIKLTDR